MQPTSSEKLALVSKIRDEFWSSNPPKLPEGWRGLCDNVKCEHYWEGIEETNLFWGKDWSALKRDDFKKCSRVFSWLPDESLAYFLGGYMVLSIQEEPYDYGFTELFHLFDPREERRKRAKQTWAMNRAKVAPLSTNQRTIVAEYLRFLEATGYAEDTSFLQGFMLGDIRE
ncbi:DUF6714 family protein [Sulfitobacter mediterraneus]|uniref:DUF6714 family protein n=1 Tax=Sulfitobacter mediterraneus TaxID=83219 RepID=UPI0005602812|nr:DUF6714 family protein [Sulfitobacter mediterraneus]